MNYENAIDWIHSREKFKVKPGLKRMDWMMEKLGHPEMNLKAIHIAGTNGKGSTVSFLRNLLQTQGYRIGTFTSPYIVRFNERISINGEPIEDEELAKLVEELKPLSEELARTPLGEPTEFEVITAMAMVYFSRQKLDFVIFETGLGGRYDSTNIIQPLLSVITNIGRDHINILGSTIEQIADEKAGIIKEGRPVLCGAKQPEALQVIKKQASITHAPMALLGKDFFVEHVGSEPAGERFIFRNKAFRSGELLSGLKGKHQVENAALALEVVEYLKAQGTKVDRSKYEESVLQTTWPARFETVRTEPLTIIDGAHNEEGTQALVDTMKRHYRGKKINLVYSALEDKPVESMLMKLSEVIDEAYFTTFDFPRALTAVELKQLSPIPASTAISDYKKAVKKASEQVEKDGVLLITGSLYFISEIRKYFE
ncbi:bifunctional folylpolyglutamate synthase/dihydrofolate synthase [Halobacillus mangrovi]|uniref:Dihydrofolate synthase/folylpolyglutamate synthase n=1 Tax=Halobacillus mangrovi TaxID=402384 RepID=A0A1W5ZUF9_9BACI|nr:folylpolyglutamate synthase/dihydrofolate synthase family protein [Halobacillus mangrovi]ARI76919.1 bifunctional folylpolyglutamate synthase/dihydrofolate synthase [Halobacillus mangrovi]